MGDQNGLELSIVIVTWNSAADIERCLAAVHSAVLPHPPEIYVVDNASTDETVARVKRGFPTVTLVENATNLGFARANNNAIARARGQYIMLLNPDTIVERGALATLCDHLRENPGVGAVGPRLVTPEGELQPSCLRYVSLPALVTGFVNGGSYAPRDQARPSRVDALSGAAFMTRRETIAQVGLLDEDFFMYGEDTDWCYRMAQSGWEIHYCPAATITHLGGQSANQIPIETYVRRRLAQLQFMRKHRADWEAGVAGRVMELNLRLHEARAAGAEKDYYRAVRARFQEASRS